MNGVINLRIEQARSSDVGVADGFNFLNAVPCSSFIEGNHHIIQNLNRFFVADSMHQLCEAHHL